MPERRILISGAYLELLRVALGHEIVPVYEFADFLNRLKEKMRAQGRDEVLDALVREEVRMIETADRFV